MPDIVYIEDASLCNTLKSWLELRFGPDCAETDLDPQKHWVFIFSLTQLALIINDQNSHQNGSVVTLSDYTNTPLSSRVHSWYWQHVLMWADHYSVVQKVPVAWGILCALPRHATSPFPKLWPPTVLLPTLCLCSLFPQGPIVGIVCNSAFSR